MSTKKTKTGSSTQTSRTRDRLALFAPPLLLEGEDPAAYDELSRRLRAAVQPADIIEEMFVADALYWRWEHRRLQQVKTGLMREGLKTALKKFLNEFLEPEMYGEACERILSEILKVEFSSHQLAEYRKDMDACADDPSKGAARIDQALASARVDPEKLKFLAKSERVKELVQAHARRQPAAIRQIDEILAANGRTLDDLKARGLTNKIADSEEIDLLTARERIDRSIAFAENRANLSLRELHRYRETLGRRNLLRAEEADYETIETKPH